MKKSVVSVDCPTCGRKVPFVAASRWRPFCSQRCKSIDLGAWAAERYRIAGQTPDDGGEADAESDPAQHRRDAVGQ